MRRGLRHWPPFTPQLSTTREEMFDGRIATIVGSRDGPSYAVIAERGRVAHNHFPTGRQEGAEAEVISVDERAWEAFWRFVDDADVWRWRERYERPPRPLGQTSWSVELHRGDRTFFASGQNSYPSGWPAFCEAVKTLAGGRDFG